MALRNRPEGLRWLVLLFVAVSTGDIAAYYGGRLLGRHPLAPSLSPHKTLEGTGFGLAASMVAAGAVGYYQIPAASLPRILALGLLLGAVGQCGDLFESALKRAAGAKDSSTLLPGHGGILDRIDSLLFAGATLYAALATKLI
ncbi:MAG: phosphatidate cytidylyltransferase [Acidobacteriota bacterium]